MLYCSRGDTNVFGDLTSASECFGKNALYMSNVPRQCHEVEKICSKIVFKVLRLIKCYLLYLRIITKTKTTIKVLPSQGYFLWQSFFKERKRNICLLYQRKVKKMLLQSMLVLLIIAFVQITRGQEAERKPGEDPSHKKCQTSF